MTGLADVAMRAAELLDAYEVECRNLPGYLADHGDPAGFMQGSIKGAGDRIRAQVESIVAGGPMTGYDEASRWLGDHAPQWRILHSEHEQVVGLRGTIEFGMTLDRYTVQLSMPGRKDGPVLVGVGATILAAAQKAIGGNGGNES